MIIQLLMKETQQSVLCCFLAGVIGLLPSEGLTQTAFFADAANERVFAIDVDNNELVAAIPTHGIIPYPVDSVGEKVYVSTRGSNSLDIIDKMSRVNLGVIPLQHKPRSVTNHMMLDLAIVSGADKVMTTIIDTSNDTIIGVVGKNKEVAATDFGGSLATGHPFWLNELRFALIDRVHRKIYMYEMKEKKRGEWKIKKLSTLKTPTSVHHLTSSRAEQDIFFAIAEGAPEDGVHPAILKIQMKGKKLTLVGRVDLNTEDASIMGCHHAKFHPDGIHIYVGSTEGHTFVVDSLTMEIVSIIETGKGNGHTSFAIGWDLAVAINHHDTFVTIIDTITHEKVKDISVTVPQIHPGRKLQSHSTYMSGDDNRYFFGCASDAGFCYEVDMESLQVSNRLELPEGSYPIQGAMPQN